MTRIMNHLKSDFKYYSQEIRNNQYCEKLKERPESTFPHYNNVSETINPDTEPQGQLYHTQSQSHLHKLLCFIYMYI